jgi:hypothetical protein
LEFVRCISRLAGLIECLGGQGSESRPASPATKGLRRAPIGAPRPAAGSPGTERREVAAGVVALMVEQAERGGVPGQAAERVVVEGRHPRRAGCGLRPVLRIPGEAARRLPRARSGVGGEIALRVVSERRAVAARHLVQRIGRRRRRARAMAGPAVEVVRARVLDDLRGGNCTRKINLVQ